MSMTQETPQRKFRVEVSMKADGTQLSKVIFEDAEPTTEAKEAPKKTKTKKSK